MCITTLLIILLTIAVTYCIIVSTFNLFNVVRKAERALVTDLNKNVKIDSDGILQIKGLQTGLGSDNRNSKVKIEGDHIDLHSINRTGDEVNPGAPIGSVQVASTDGKLVNTHLTSSHITDFRVEARNAVNTKKAVSNFIFGAYKFKQMVDGVYVHKIHDQVTIYFPEMILQGDGLTPPRLGAFTSNYFTDMALKPKGPARTMIYLVTDWKDATANIFRAEFTVDHQFRLSSDNGQPQDTYELSPFSFSYLSENDTPFSGVWGYAAPSVTIERVSVNGSASSGVVKTGEVVHLELTFDEEVTKSDGKTPLDAPSLVKVNHVNGPTVSPTDPKKYAFSVIPSVNSTGTASVQYLTGTFKGKTSEMNNIQDFTINFEVDTQAPTGGTIVASNTIVTPTAPTGTITLTFLETVSIGQDTKLIHSGLNFGSFTTTDNKVYTINYQRNAAAIFPINPPETVKFFGTVTDQNGNSHVYNTLDTANPVTVN